MKRAALIIVGIFSCLLLICASGIFNHSFAQTTPYTAVSSYVTANTDPNVPQDLHSLVQILTIDVYSSISCELSGFDPTRSDHRCLGINSTTGKIGFVTTTTPTYGAGGLIGLAVKGIGFSFNLPVHTSDYIAYETNKFGFGEKAYAATDPGTGFNSLTPLLSTWVAFRNVAYLLFVLAFIIIGVGIMLRIQIDPRTVMTIENQLPKIVIGLILVTFSFAIAGFMIDLMWVFTFFVINIMAVADAGKGSPFASDATNYLFETPLFYFNRIWAVNFSGIITLTNTLTGGFSSFISAAFMSGNDQGLHVATGGPNNSCTAITSIIPNFQVDWGCLIGSVIGWLLWLIFTVLDITIGWIIFLLAIVILLIRLWIALLKNYIYIILCIVLAPFYIIGSVLPGSTLGFGSWLKTLAANLLAYPAVIFLFLLARVINDQLGQSGTVVSLFVPPLIGNPNAGGVGASIGSSGGTFIGAMITIGILFVAPGVPGIINKMFGNEGIGLGALALGGIAAGGRLFGSTAQNIGSGIGSYTALTPDRSGHYNPAGWKGVLRSKFRG